MRHLTEDTRNQLIAQGKAGAPEKGDGKTRYQKRIKSRIASSTRQYNKIDMNALFKDNILTVGIEVTGETDSYVVTVSFGGFLDNLQKELSKTNNFLSLRTIVRALVTSFNSDNVYFRCSCPDHKYRMAYWNSRADIITGQKETIPSDITNPDNKLGSGCKHMMLVISNHSWLIKVASTINNYIKYMEKHMAKAYAEIIYPAVYGKAYEEPVQLSIFDKDTLSDDTDTIDVSNEEGRLSGRFSSTYQPNRTPSNSGDDKS